MPNAALSLLQSFPLFADVPESTLKELASSCAFRSVTAGVRINPVGSGPRFVFCLGSGVVESWSRYKKAETIVATFSAPIILDLSTAIENRQGVIDFVSRSPCDLIAIEANAFIQAIKMDAALCHIALKQASRVNLVLTDRLITHKLRTTEQRLGRWIVDAMEIGGNSESVRIGFSKRALALELGMSPANLSRLFNVVKGYGVEVSGATIRITDPAKLKELVNG